MLGAGGMARTHMEAFTRVRKIEKLQVFSPTRENRERFAHEMATKYNIEVKSCSRPEEVYKGAHILAALTDSAVEVTDGAWLEKGTHIVVVGGTGKPDAESRKRVEVYLRFGDTPAPTGHPNSPPTPSISAIRRAHSSTSMATAAVTAVNTATPCRIGASRSPTSPPARRKVAKPAGSDHVFRARAICGRAPSSTPWRARVDESAKPAGLWAYDPNPMVIAGHSRTERALFQKQSPFQRFQSVPGVPPGAQASLTNTSLTATLRSNRSKRSEDQI